MATIVAASFGVDAPGVSVTGYNETSNPLASQNDAPNHQVLTGLDVMEQENFAAAPGQARRSDHQSDRPRSQGRRNIDAMLAAGSEITALFSPEHG